MLQPTELDSPNEALNFLNSIQPNAPEWNLLLQESTNLFVPEKETLNPAYHYNNTLSVGMPDQNWTNYYPPTYDERAVQDEPKDPLNDLLLSPRTSKDCRFNCLPYSSCSQDYFIPYSTMGISDDIRNQYPEDPRYDIPKLPDIGSDITNIIDVADNVENEFLEVVDTDDESEIIVEDSDTESEISISDVGPYLAEQEQVQKLCCIVCGVHCKESTVSNFTHLNTNFPLTYITKTPIVIKLVEIIPLECQNLVKYERVLICRRCLNLIDAVESFECKLVEAKQEICGFLSKPHRVDFQTEFSNFNKLIDCGNIEFQDVQPATIFENVSQLQIVETLKIPEIVEKTEEKTESEKPTEKPIEKPKEKNKGTYQCDRCGRFYSNKKKLDNHLAKHLGLFKYKCEHCSKGFMKESNLQIHLRIHKTERKFQCHSCPLSFKIETEYASHSCTEMRFMCDKCPKIFNTDEKFKNHQNSVHGEKTKNVCKVCLKEFKYPSDLAKHAASHETDKNFVCPHCEKGFKGTTQLNQHVRLVHEKCFSCSLCNLEFKSSKEVRKHAVDEHGRSDKYECDKCEKTFVEKRYLSAHQKVHAGTAKTNTCPICNKTLRSNLKAHMMAHSAEKQFHCDICDIKFTFRSGLDKHKKLKHQSKQKQ